MLGRSDILGFFQGHGTAAPGFWKGLDMGEVLRHSALTRLLSSSMCAVANSGNPNMFPA